MGKTAKWDGERFKPTLMGECERPLAETSAEDLEILKADLVVADRGLEKIFARDKQADDGVHLKDGERRLVMTMFDDREMTLTGKTLKAIIRNVERAMVDPTARWRSAKLIRGDATHELSNPNREVFRAFTNGRRQWTDRIQKFGGGMANCAAAKKVMNQFMSKFREPQPRDRLDWAEKFLASLPKVEDLVVNTIDEPERWNAWAEMADGERVEATGGSDHEAGVNLEAKLRQRKAKMICGGTEKEKREYRVEKHPLNESKFEVSVLVGRALAQFEKHGEDSSVAKAWQIGLDLGIAIERLSRIAATPDIMHAVKMNGAVAGSRPKSKTDHLKNALTYWLRNQDATLPKASLAADFFSYTSGNKGDYRVTGKGTTDRKSSIRHKSDKAELKLNHIEKNVIPAILKSFSETGSAAPDS
jgi:hypothetical protein